MHRANCLAMSWNQARLMLVKNGLASKAESKAMLNWLKTDEPPPPEAMQAINRAWFLMVLPPVNRLQ